MPATDEKKPFTKQATAKLFAMLNRADELGGEVRDYIQDRVVTDPRYVSARKRIAKLLGKDYQSRDEVSAAAKAAEAKRASVAAPTPVAKPVDADALGNPNIKAQVYGKKSCPWTGRAITVLERNKVDFDFVDLEEPEHEPKMLKLSNETKQHTVPFVYLRGQFIGGYNALAEVERLGQLEFALMSKDERDKAPSHIRVEIVPRPNTDEIVPADQVRPDDK